MTEPSEGQQPPAGPPGVSVRALHQRDRPAVRLHLRDRAAGLAQLLDAARAGVTRPGR